MAWLLVADGLLRVFQKLLIYCDFPTMVYMERLEKSVQFFELKCLVNARGLMRMTAADRKKTGTRITACYNQSMQESISKCTTCQTSKQMGYRSKSPQLLLSAKNRKLVAQLT